VLPLLRQIRAAAHRLNLYLPQNMIVPIAKATFRPAMRLRAELSKSGRSSRRAHSVRDRNPSCCIGFKQAFVKRIHRLQERAAGNQNSPDPPPSRHVKISPEQQGRVRENHNATACRRDSAVSSLSQQTRAIFAEAMRSIDLRRAVQQHLHCDATTLILGEANVPLREVDQVLVLAIGKAAVPMYQAADEILHRTSQLQRRTRRRSRRSFPVGPVTMASPRARSIGAALLNGSPAPR
jgi:hypothetical protein